MDNNNWQTFISFPFLENENTYYDLKTESYSKVALLTVV